MDQVQLQQGQDAKPYLSLNLSAFYIADIGETAVLAAVPVVAQKEILVLPKAYRRVRHSGQGHLLQPVLGGEQLAVDKHHAALDLYGLAGQSDHPLDILLLVLALEYHHVEALGLAQIISQTVN